jgi:hypothetical protein
MCHCKITLVPVWPWRRCALIAAAGPGLSGAFLLRGPQTVSELPFSLRSLRVLYSMPTPAETRRTETHTDATGHFAGSEPQIGIRGEEGGESGGSRQGQARPFTVRGPLAHGGDGLGVRPGRAHIDQTKDPDIGPMLGERSPRNG